MAARNKWIWGISGTTKYAVKDLTNIHWRKNEVHQNFQVIAHTRIGYQKILLKNCESQLEATKFINETFPSR